MSDVVDPSGSLPPTDDPELLEEVSELSEEELDEDGREIGKGILYIGLAAVFIGFFVWLLIGLWGYLQEMSYGHG